MGFPPDLSFLNQRQTVNLSVSGDMLGCKEIALFPSSPNLRAVDSPLVTGDMKITITARRNVILNILQNTVKGNLLRVFNTRYHRALSEARRKRLIHASFLFCKRADKVTSEGFSIGFGQIMSKFSYLGAVIHQKSVIILHIMRNIFMLYRARFITLPGIQYYYIL